MRRFDVFNGDADGICALHQLRLAEPAPSGLVTGLKRDVALLARVAARPGDQVTVLDISLENNREALVRLLDLGASVRWFDHHHAGAIPSHPRLAATIEHSDQVCTSLLVDHHLAGRFRPWALVGAFGDNLVGPARRIAAALGLDAAATEALRALGEDLNYGASGESMADVLMPPLETYRLVSRHRDPLRLGEEPFIAKLRRARLDDLRLAQEVAPRLTVATADAYVLPDAPWSRRVMGTFANLQANAQPGRAHAVLVPNAQGGYAVSVRSPAGPGPTAAVFCCRYLPGGGRARAGGIENLPGEGLEDFLAALARAWAP